LAARLRFVTPHRSCTPLLLADASTNLFLLGLTLIVAVLIRRVTKSKVRSSTVDAPFHGAASRPSALHSLDAPRDVSRWEVHMYELARDLAGTLDSKIGVLQQLVLDADRRIELLGRTDSGPSNSGPSDNVQGNSPRGGSAAQAEHLQRLLSIPARRSASSPSPPAASTAPAGQRADAPVQGRDEGLAQREIYRLADAGYGGSAIAQLIDAPLGDVELMLSLRSASSSK